MSFFRIGLRGQKWATAAGAGVVGSLAVIPNRHSSCQQPAAPKVYSRAEVAKHTSKDTGIWVSHEDGVYDITKFIDNHPGGKDKILLAAGKDIGPFWRIYQQHQSRGTAPKIMAEMRIGDLADPIPKTEHDSSDPYDADPERHPGLIFHNNKPCNAECPTELLMDSWCTPNPVWFIRHHHPVPHVDPNEYRLYVYGKEGAKPITITLEDLKTRFVKQEVTTTIQCGGNRRGTFDSIQKTSGISWGVGAMSTAKFGGVRLRDVLQHCAGLNSDNVESHGLEHVVFHGYDDMQASIPIQKALNPFGDVLLAYEMNDEVLPPEHGYPIRAVVPGHVGVRNVKWLQSIRASPEEAEGTWQRGIAYKGFSPMVRSFTHIDVEKILSIQEQPVTSVILSPKSGAETELDDVEVKGFAYSGGGRGIVRVDVSADEGKTWVTADMKEGSEQHPNRSWAWTFFSADVPIPAHCRGKQFNVLCRAIDASYNTQPEFPESIWNLRGLNCNSWHRVSVKHCE